MLKAQGAFFKVGLYFYLQIEIMKALDWKSKRAGAWMNLEDTMFSEISQAKKDMHCMISLICRLWKIIQIKVYAKQKKTHRYRKQNFSYQRWEGIEGERGQLGVWD